MRAWAGLVLRYGGSRCAYGAGVASAPADWIKAESTLSVFIAAKAAWLSTDLQTCPDARLGDGLIDLLTSEEAHTRSVRSSHLCVRLRVCGQQGPRALTVRREHVWVGHPHSWSRFSSTPSRARSRVRRLSPIKRYVCRCVCLRLRG
jgi:hypothetical protein